MDLLNHFYLFTETENEIVLDFYFRRRKRCTVAVEIYGPNLRSEQNMGARPLACKPTIYGPLMIGVKSMTFWSFMACKTGHK